MKNLVVYVQGKTLAVFFSLMTLTCFANNSTFDKSIFDLMNYRDVLELTLETDLTSLKSNRQDESYHKAHISFKDANGKKQQWDLKVKLRGAFRRVKCSDVPPLKLNFKKSDLEAAGLSPFDDLKLVPQCIADDENAKEVLLKEFLVYKMFNEVSEYSFRVQLLRITYLDTATGNKDKQWAFLIEDTAQLRERLEGDKMTDEFNMPQDSFHLSQARLVSLFEYMIGNADWGFSTMKNLKFLKKKGKIVPVPYDFDFSGLVSAPYALPNRNVGQMTLGDRVYLGFADDTTDLHGTIYHLVGKRGDLEKVVMDFKPLSYDARLEVIAYLSSFFENPENIRTAAFVAQGRTPVVVDR